MPYFNFQPKAGTPPLQSPVREPGLALPPILPLFASGVAKGAVRPQPIYGYTRADG